GFMLGDGRLNYGLEKLAEAYYQAALTQNLFVTGAYQILDNPGYNKDRKGPVNIFSIRVHTRI
ncbi:MAG TPA: carbohydrate porin, partial [Chitinophagaceae bacterium]|nr:carbohydrate porin [Chitinophagaceae bacterium]